MLSTVLVRHVPVKRKINKRNKSESERRKIMKESKNKKRSARSYSVNNYSRPVQYLAEVSTEIHICFSIISARNTFPFSLLTPIHIFLLLSPSFSHRVFLSLPFSLLLSVSLHNKCNSKMNSKVSYHSLLRNISL